MKSLPVACIVAVILLLPAWASASEMPYGEAPPCEFPCELQGSIPHPPHTWFAGRADTTPIESNDVELPDTHASFQKSGPPGPGVDDSSDSWIYNR